jgi:hypothetical protein
MLTIGINQISGMWSRFIELLEQCVLYADASQAQSQDYV